MSRAAGGGVLQGALEPVAGTLPTFLQWVVDGVGVAVVVRLQEHVGRAQTVGVEARAQCTRRAAGVLKLGGGLQVGTVLEQADVDRRDLQRGDQRYHPVVRQQGKGEVRACQLRRRWWGAHATLTSAPVRADSQAASISFMALHPSSAGERLGAVPATTSTRFSAGACRGYASSSASGG